MSTYKFSRYNIITDEINFKKERIIYSSRSCKPLLLSESVYKRLLDNNLNSIPSNIIDTLANSKILVLESENELETILKENISMASSYTEHLYEVIQPTSNCQLDCAYCGQIHSNSNISESICLKIIQRIINKLKRNNCTTLTIGWFGGEPLLAISEITFITKKLVTYCDLNSIKYSAKIVTNGIILDADTFESLIEDLRVHEVEITIDGTKEFHDQLRFTKSKEGSFDLIYSNLNSIVERKNAKKLNCLISIRCNVNKFNEAGVSPLLNLLAKQNLSKYILFYVKSIYSWARNDAHKNSITQSVFAKKEIGWIKEMIDLSFPSPIDIPKRKSITCIANSPFSEMYDAYGNVFNCSEVSYSDVYKNSQYYLGNLKEKESIAENKIFKTWHNEVLTNKSMVCKSCNVYPICGGSCPKAWHENNSPCPPMKYNLAEKLELKYLLTSNTKSVNEYE